MLQGSCDCGAVRYTVDAPLTEVTECNCGICRRSGALWSYHSQRVVTMSGPTQIYLRGHRILEFHFCAACSCLMWWIAVDRQHERMGVNARMLPLGSLENVPVDFCDAASW